MNGPVESGEFSSGDEAREVFRAATQSQHDLDRSYGGGEVTYDEFRKQWDENFQTQQDAAGVAMSLGVAAVDLWSDSFELQEDEQHRQRVFDSLQFDGRPDMDPEDFQQLADQFGLETLTEERRLEMEQNRQAFSEWEQKWGQGQAVSEGWI